MSYSNNQPPRRTAPLIQRPSAASASASSPSSAAPNAHLAGSIANAFAGMGYSYPTTHYNPAFHPHLPPNPGFQQPPSYIPQVPQYPIHQYPQGQSVAAYGQPNYYAAQGYPAAGPSAYPYPYSQPAAVAVPGPSQQSVQIPPQRHGLPARPAPPTQQQLKRPRTLDGKAAAAASGSNSALPLPYQDDHQHAPPPPPAAPPRARAQQRGPEVVRCCKDDCAFTGSRKAVREHEEDRHLIFAPGREPKPWNGSLKPIDGSVIEGTGISLDTPEALARWIEERKKRWPSKKVVEEKEKARAERIAAGLEAPPRERGGGRGRGRGRGGASDVSARGGRGRGGLVRGGYSGGGGYEEGGSEQILRAQGETEMDAERVEDEPPAAKRLKMSEAGRDGDRDDNNDDDDDDDKKEEEEEDDEDDGPPEEMAAKPPMAVDSLPTKPADPEEEASSSAPSLGEPPRDCPEQLDRTVAGSAAGAGQGGGAEQGGGDEPAPKRFQVVCRHWRKGHCALGDVDCPYLHHLPPNAGPPPPPKRRRPAPPPAPHNPFARPAGFSDPFSLVEERDHRHIVADVLQVIEFLGANDWLQGVEIRRGQVDEESGIQIIGETTQDEAVVGERKEEEPSEQTAAIVEVSEGADEEVLPQSSAVDLSSDARRETTAPTRLAPDSDATAPVPAASKSSTSGAGVGLFADYGSDSDDEAEVEQAVASALLSTAP